jgi:hypothetical protein
MDFRIVHWLTRLYNAMLRLYRAVSIASLPRSAEVFTGGWRRPWQSSFALGQLCLHELISLPVSIARAHRQARAGLQTSSGRLLHNYPLEQSWKELLVALAVFLLPR